MADASTPPANEPAPAPLETADLRVVYARNTFDLRRLDSTDARASGRPAQAKAGEPVLVSVEEAERFGRIGLVQRIWDAPTSLAVEPIRKPGSRKGAKPERLLIHRGGGWYDVVRPDGTLANAEPVRGKDAALALDL